jgi:TonB family protein
MLVSRWTYLPVAVLVFAAGSPTYAAESDKAESMSGVILKNYPAESLARGEEGTVAFAVDVDSRGKIESCVVSRSSGYPRLDDATCDLLVRLATFAPAKAEGRLVATTRTGQISWHLPPEKRPASAPPRTNVSKTELEAKRLICRRGAAVGSLVKVTAYCLSKAQWAEADMESWKEQQRFMGLRQSPNGCDGGKSFGC